MTRETLSPIMKFARVEQTFSKALRLTRTQKKTVAFLCQQLKMLCLNLEYRKILSVPDTTQLSKGSRIKSKISFTLEGTIKTKKVNISTAPLFL
jgi:hypothetical protein